MKKQLYLKQSLFLIFLLFSISGTFSQISSYVHFDRPIYLSGEDVFFSIYAEAFGEIAETHVFLEVYNQPNGHRVYHSFVKMHFGEAGGSLLLPAATETRDLIAHISFFDSAKSEFKMLVSAKLEVINPADTINIYHLSQRRVPLKHSVNLALEKPGGPYWPGSDIKLLLKSLSSTGMPLEGVASVAITHQPYASKSIDLKSLQYYQSDDVYIEGSKKFTWQRQLVFEESGQPVRNANIGIFSQDEGEVVMQQTNADGMFTWQSLPYYGERQIQYFCPTNDSVKILPWWPENIRREESFYSDSILVNVRSYLDRANMRNKIIYLLGTPVAKPGIQSASKQWPFNPDFTLSMEDYENVESLADLSKLLLTPLRIRRSKNELKPRMINPIDKPFFKEAPLFIIDQCLQKDNQRALSLKMQHVIRIDFYNTPETLRHFGKLGRNGVISIITKFPQLYQSDHAEILVGLTRNEQLSTDGTINDIGVSSLRSVVYWNPSLKFDKDGQAMINFKQTDDLGTFNIEVFFHTPDGALGHVVERYEVVVPSAGN